MEAFKKIWIAIDTSGNEEITSEELKEYMLKNNYEDGFVEKWMEIFDTDGSGIIKLQEFCDALGFNYKEISSEVQQNVASGVMPKGVEVLKSDMEQSWQIKLIQLCLEGLSAKAKLQEVPVWIKKQADERYSQLWHVMIVKGQFWCDYGHAPGFALSFKYEKFIFIIWKTPVA